MNTLYLLTFALAAHCQGMDFQQIDEYLKNQHFQGTALIAQEGRILFHQGYGLANEEFRLPNGKDTVYRIGSITKQFTAAAILQLQERGKLHVNDPINKYLPGYPRGDQITIHHLLSHTSGIPSITDFANLEEIQRHPSHPKQAMAYFQELPLEFTPGSTCAYSDSGYIILGAILEAVAGMSYEKYLQEHFFKPLGMHHTYFDRHESIIPNRASGYIMRDGKKFNANYLDMSFPHAAGSLATTAEDLYKFGRAVKGSTPLFTIHGKGKNITYGYGFFIGPHNEELEGARESLIGHYGTIEGFRAASYRYTDDDLTIILLSNLENTDINRLHLDIARIVHSWRP
jgi:CubicO group peptidase (beta-lactamase class C family)